MYQCTYPGCHEQRLSVDAIESHVRVGHLNRPEELDLSIDDSERDHEEEFYYTETEYEEVIDVEPPQLQVKLPSMHKICEISVKVSITSFHSGGSLGVLFFSCL